MSCFQFTPFLSTEAQIAQKLSKSLVSLSAIVTFEFPLFSDDDDVIYNHEHPR